jgi:uncharacterized glyoxalase superfamily metalloenzyme YdcJ
MGSEQIQRVDELWHLEVEQHGTIRLRNPL